MSRDDHVTGHTTITGFKPEAPTPPRPRVRFRNGRNGRAGAPGRISAQKRRAMSECRALGVIDNLIDLGRAIEMRPL
jgi:hypothetical protein